MNFPSYNGLSRNWLSHLCFCHQDLTFLQLALSLQPNIPISCNIIYDLTFIFLVLSPILTILFMSGQSMTCLSYFWSCQTQIDSPISGLIIFGLTILLLVLYCYASLTCLANYVLIVLFLVLPTRNTSWLSGFCFRSSSSWSSSGTCSKVQIIPLLVSLWNQQSGPDHHFSGQPLDSTVGTRSSLLWSTLIPTVGTRSSLFWSAYGPNGLDQIKFFLVSLWSN